MLNNYYIFLKAGSCWSGWVQSWNPFAVIAVTWHQTQLILQWEAHLCLGLVACVSHPLPPRAVEKAFLTLSMLYKILSLNFPSPAIWIFYRYSCHKIYFKGKIMFSLSFPLSSSSFSSVFFFWDRFSLYSVGYHGVHHVDLAGGLTHRDPPAFAWVLRLKVCTSLPCCIKL